MTEIHKNSFPGVFFGAEFIFGIPKAVTLVANASHNCA